MADVLKKQMGIKVGSVTGTTSTNGILYVPDIEFDDITLINCWASDSNSAIPFENDTSKRLGFRVVSTSGVNWQIIANQNRTVYYTYIDRPLQTYS